MPQDTTSSNAPEKPRSGDSDYPLTGDRQIQPPADEQEQEIIELDPDQPDKPAPVKPTGKNQRSRLGRFKAWYGGHKRWSIPATVLSLLVIVAVIPWSRYQAAGLVVKRDFSIQVLDSKTGSPVSGATVSDGTISGTSDGSGKATLQRLKVGHHSFTISKANYQDQRLDLLVPIMAQKDPATTNLVATGRAVRISVKNVITQKPLAGVSIKIRDIEAKTAADGSAVVVVPAGSTSEEASLKLDGYNLAKAKIKVSPDKVQDNNLTLTPAGKVYFLSNLSGKIDVVKTNLDGSSRETVLPGTGKEDADNTVLLASRDWKYLALIARRDSNKAKLYIINTANDQLSVVDQGNVDFSPVGWRDHYFVYRLSHPDYDTWQSNAVSLKSYNAETGRLLTLANTSATGTNDGDAQFEAIWDTLLMGDNVIYTKTWYQAPGYLEVDGKQNVLASIHPDGTQPRKIKTVDSAGSYITNLKLEKPDQLYFAVQGAGNNDTTYYLLNGAGQVTKATGVSGRNILSRATSYYLSPSEGSAFWAEKRDGKNSLFVGDNSAGNGKQIAALSSYQPYGWFTDDYLLVSKDDSELYIIPKSGVPEGADAVKISDYYKPDFDSFYGGI